jgi:hypothetical protein
VKFRGGGSGDGGGRVAEREMTGTRFDNDGLMDGGMEEGEGRTVDGTVERMGGKGEGTVPMKT